MSLTTPATYPRTPLWPGSPSKDRDDRVCTNPQAFIGRPLVITEKLDGLNLLLNRGEIHPSSKEPNHTANLPWLAMVKKHHAWKLAAPERENIHLYPEDLYAVHSIEYAPMPEDQTLRAFGSISHQSGWFDEFQATLDLAAALDIKSVPILHRGIFESHRELQDLLDTVHDQPSALGGPREGTVIRMEDSFPLGRFHLNVCKSVRISHVQKQQHWTHSWRPCRLPNP